MPLLTLLPESSSVLASSLDSPFPSVRVLWRPEQFNRVTNPGFETNTSGWSVAAAGGIDVAAATSITRITTDAHSGTACASVVTSGTYLSGASYSLTGTFFAEYEHGAVYMARAWVKWVSGPRRLRMALGASSGYGWQDWDITGEWQRITVRWAPQASLSSWYVGFAAAATAAMTFLVDDVEVYLADAFSQVENGTFETNTTGWVVTAGTFAAAATSITRTASGFGGSYCGRLVTTATASSGTTYSLGTRTFVSGRTYRARAAFKAVSGTAAYTMTLGRSGDSASVSVTPTDTWAWATVDWTPAADRTDVQLGIYSAGSSVRSVDFDEVEVYEAADDLGTDAGDLDWNRVVHGVGTLAVRLENGDGRYDPRNAASDLYGLVDAGRRVHVRAVYDEALHGCFWGTITTIEAQPFDARADIIAEDVMGDARRTPVALDFRPDLSYTEVRRLLVQAMLTQKPRAETVTDITGASRISAGAGIEDNTFYSGTDDLVMAGELLDDMDEATQSVSWFEPSPHANIGWRLVTVDRGALTDNTSDFTVDEDFEDLSGVRLTHEARETQQVVPWQAYEYGPTSPREAQDGTEQVAQAYTADVGTPLFQPDQDPYLHYTRDVYGDSLDVPEPSYRISKRWKRRPGTKHRPRGRKLVTKRTRVYPDPFVPLTIAAGEEREYTIDFAVAVHGLNVAANMETVTLAVSPHSITVRIIGTSTATTDSFAVRGDPYTVLEEREVEAYSGSGDIFQGPSFATPYIPSLGAAEGIAAYRNWRFGDARLRPQVVHHNEFPRTLTMDLCDHVTLSADRWYIDGSPFVVTGMRWSVTATGLDWRSWADIEELPTHTDWFTLDSSALDGSDVLAY